MARSWIESGGGLLPAHSIIEQVGDEAIFLLDLEGHVASWNQGVRTILGWDKSEWIGQPVRVAFCREDADAGVPEAELKQAALAGCVQYGRWMRRKNGESFCAQGSLTRLRDDQGHLVGYLHALRDGTAARRAEEGAQRLLDVERRSRAWAENHATALTTAIESIADGVFISDLHGVRRCNDAALSLLGAGSLQDFDADLAALAQRFRLRREHQGPLIPPEELPVSNAWRGRSSVQELWTTHAITGADVFLRCAASPIVVDDQVVGTVVVLTNLTERQQLRQKRRDLRRAQRLLQGRDAELRALVQGVRDYAIFTLDPEGHIVTWPPGAQLMKGYTVDEAVGMPFAQLFTRDEQEAGLPQNEMAIAARTGEYKGEGKRVRKDGSMFDAAVVLTALRGDDGELLGFLKLTQDITQRRSLERQRDEMLRAAQAQRAEAERSSRSKGEFLATISHELRTPLSAILGWAQVLEHGVIDPATVEHGLAAISRNARTQIQLIEDLLDMSRIESGQLRLDLQRIELGGVIAAAIDSALPAASAKGIGLRTVFAPANGNVMGDAARLQQAVANLLSNSIKFTPAGGQISVTLSQGDGHAQIAVSDTGQGIEPDFLVQMFDRFQQQDATTTRRHGGLGLGLSIVRHLVQLHGGTVEAYSAGSGRGATFTLTLPTPASAPLAGPAAGLQPAAAPAAATEGSACPVAAMPRLDGITVLLVEDEPDVRAVTARLLEDAGASLLLAENAGQALDILRRQRPSVLLSDIGMPEVDGYELMRRVRQLPAAEGGLTQAAAFTAFARPEDHAQALAAGYQLHLAKPVQVEHLLRAVATLARSACIEVPPGDADAL